MEEEIDDMNPSESKQKRGLWALIILLILFLGFMLADRSRHVAKEDQWRSLALSTDKQAILWRNKAGLSQAEAQANVVSYNVFKESSEKDKAALMLQLGVKERELKNLKSVTETTIDTDISVSTRIKDSVITNSDSTTTTFRRSSYTDRWVQLSVIFSEDSADWKVHSKDSLVFVGISKKDHWYSLRRKSYLNGQSFNPYSTITGLSHIEIASPKRSRIGIGPYVGIGINGRPQVGLGVFYRLFEF